MSDTPRTDARPSAKWGIVDADFARQLERALAAADEAAKRWYEAAAPYATPEALKAALRAEEP